MIAFDENANLRKMAQKLNEEFLSYLVCGRSNKWTFLAKTHLDKRL